VARHRIGLVMLIASLVIAAAIVLLRDPRVPLLPLAIVTWGLLVFGTTALVSLRKGSSHRAPSVERLPAPFPPSPAAEPSPDSTPREPEDWVRPVEVALRHLNSPGVLSNSELISRMPRTLEASRRQWGQGSMLDPTPLDQARALGEVLNAAIDALKPVHADDDAAEALQYLILHEEYRLGMETKHITVRHAISEATFHRYRRAAVRAVAGHIKSREEALRVAPRDLM